MDIDFINYGNFAHQHLNLHKDVSINCDFVFGDITFIKNKLS